MYTPAPESNSKMCRWCDGAGTINKPLAYVPGASPFDGPAYTAVRSAQCKHCGGTGEYDSATDPTLDHDRGRTPPDNAA
ncbi:hypothetical protein ACIQNU_21070 [Streptomyces sp. NPDC091292]|uniref:hypothetical protein n=1 Tax=Streptomyces sp. NPDC091292 TaxID=3365991 RepID=UPI00381F7172